MKFVLVRHLQARQLHADGECGVSASGRGIAAQVQLQPGPGVRDNHGGVQLQARPLCQSVRDLQLPADRRRQLYRRRSGTLQFYFVALYSSAWTGYCFAGQLEAERVLRVPEEPLPADQEDAVPLRPLLPPHYHLRHQRHPLPRRRRPHRRVLQGLHSQRVCFCNVYYSILTRQFNMKIKLILQ
jgi:hypothetical protein